MGHSFKELIVWQKSKTFAVDLYRISAKFPAAERYGLTAQLRRAAVSVSSNIAEGQGRITKGEFLQFLGHARGSLLEIETQCAIALDLGFMSHEEYSGIEKQSAEVLRLLNALMESMHSARKTVSV